MLCATAKMTEPGDYFALDTSENNIAQIVAITNENFDEDQNICAR